MTRGSRGLASRKSGPARLHREQRDSQRPGLELGLRANWRQFAILVVINAFVGAMVGLERSALPLAAAHDFGIASASSVLAFIATFGLAKAATNLIAGWSVERHGRRSTLLFGWLLGLPVPFLILWAPRWEWIVAANALLGVSQGFTWSTTVIMKIDLVGPKRRGLAMGLNEFAGYVALAAAALLSGFAAARWGLRAGPAFLGLGIVCCGSLISFLLVRDTTEHARLEQRRFEVLSDHDRPRLSTVLRRSLWSDRALSSLNQAGFANNLNDGLAWGLFPIFFGAAELTIRQVAGMVAIYPAVWGVCQLWTGALSDRWGRKSPIVIGMMLQGFALLGMTLTQNVAAWASALVLLGVGTALVYPALLAAVGDIAKPSWRGTAIGVYRLWRDLGYVAGAVVAGIVADALGVAAAIAVVGVITIGSGVIVAARFNESGAPA